MAEHDATVLAGQGQPAQGAIDTYGEKYDVIYKSANNWKARRQSLASNGTVQVGANHWLVGACTEGISPEEGGHHDVSYSLLMFLTIAGIAKHFEQELLDAAPFFTLKLHRFARLFRDLDDADLLPPRPHPPTELAAQLKIAIDKLPEEQRTTTLADIVKQEPYPAGYASSTVLDHMSYGRMLLNDTDGGLLLMIVVCLLAGGYTLEERQSATSAVRAVDRQVGPVGSRQVAPADRVADVLAHLGSTMPPWKLAKYLPISAVPGSGQTYFTPKTCVSASTARSVLNLSIYLSTCSPASTHI